MSIITDLRNAYAMEVSIGIAEAINPISSLEAPVAIMVLEGYARELRERFKDAGREAEEAPFFTLTCRCGLRMWSLLGEITPCPKCGRIMYLETEGSPETCVT